MQPTEVLIKPILTEKANTQQEKLSRYSFKVNKKANKLEIKKAVDHNDTTFSPLSYHCQLDDCDMPFSVGVLS